MRGRAIAALKACFIPTLVLTFSGISASGILGLPLSAGKMQQGPAIRPAPAPECSSLLHQPKTPKQEFDRGVCRRSPQDLIDAGVFVDYPLIGSVSPRKKKLQFIVLHSTETVKPADAQRVIRSWNNRGRRHPGTQYVVDRDGVIYQTTDPSMATIHVNIYRTLFGVDNHNSLGIEMVRSGKQKYTQEQMDSTVRLVVYLREKFGLSEKQVVTHGQIQPSTRTDPVDFSLPQFNEKCSRLLQAAILAQSPTEQSGSTIVSQGNSALGILSN